MLSSRRRITKEGMERGMDRASGLHVERYEKLCELPGGKQERARCPLSPRISAAGWVTQVAAKGWPGQGDARQKANQTRIIWRLFTMRKWTFRRRRCGESKDTARERKAGPCALMVLVADFPKMKVEIRAAVGIPNYSLSLSDSPKKDERLWWRLLLALWFFSCKSFWLSSIE